MIIQEVLDKRVEDKVFRFQGRISPPASDDEEEVPTKTTEQRVIKEIQDHPEVFSNIKVRPKSVHYREG